MEILVASMILYVLMIVPLVFWRDGRGDVIHCRRSVAAVFEGFSHVLMMIMMTVILLPTAKYVSRQI